MWRPKDWEDVYCEKYCPVMDVYDPDPMIAGKAFETGADAMLEALMAKYRVKMPSDFKSILLVIPEEEEC